jgi:hypothetical protein
MHFHSPFVGAVHSAVGKSKNSRANRLRGCRARVSSLLARPDAILCATDRGVRAGEARPWPGIAGMIADLAAVLAYVAAG